MLLFIENLATLIMISIEVVIQIIHLFIPYIERTCSIDWYVRIFTEYFLMIGPSR